MYDKKLLAIIKCFKYLRFKLKRIKVPVKVIINYESLDYFMITKKLTKYQVHQVEFLSEFHFVISYIPNKEI